MAEDDRTDALHQALRGQPIDDGPLIALLLLAIGGRTVTVISGVAGRYRASGLGALAVPTWPLLNWFGEAHDRRNFARGLCNELSEHILSLFGAGGGRS